MTTTIRAAMALSLACLMGSAIPSPAQTAADTARTMGEGMTSSAMKAAMTAGASGTVGAIAIRGAWTRQNPPGARVGGGYATIANGGEVSDRLIAVSAPFAARGEVHRMEVTDGVMRMRELTEGLEIAPGKSVTLEPGGYHMMFLDITEPPMEGSFVPVTLVFERAGEVTLDLPVAAIGARSVGVGDAVHGTRHGAMKHGAMKHDGMDHDGEAHGHAPATN